MATQELHAINGNARLACGFTHSVALLPPKNDVYVWGKGEPSAEGRAGPLGRAYEITVENPQRIGSFASGVVSVHAGAAFTALLHQNGSLTTWGAPPGFEYGEDYFLYEDKKTGATFWSERLLANPTARVVTAAIVSCGAAHILMVDNCGKVYSWGNGMSGALGHGNLQDCAVAKPIGTLNDYIVTSVAAGARHSLCCTKDGAVFSWGNGENAKLGLKDPVGKSLPSRLDITFVAASVACGESHSCLTTPSGELYVWGAGAFGRLGLGFECGDIVTPTRVDALWNARETVCQISLGMLHSACITRSPDGTRKLFVWGSGSFGKLGPLSGNNQLLPVEPFPRYQGFAEVRCGSSHTVILMESGEVLTMGMEGSSWVGKRKKDSEPASLSDFFLEAFLTGEVVNTKAIRKAGYGSSNQSRVMASYVIDIDDSDWPDLTMEEAEERDLALRMFIERGLLPTKQMETKGARVRTDIIQRILWSHPWNGDRGVSETSLQSSKDALAELRYNLRAECGRLTELIEDITQLDKVNGKLIRNYLRPKYLRGTFGNLVSREPLGDGISGDLGMNAKAQRQLNMDPSSLFSFRGFTKKGGAPFGGLSLRNPLETAPSAEGCTGCLPWRNRSAHRGRIKKTRQILEMENQTFFTQSDFNSASIILSYLLANPERMYLFWSSIHQPTSGLAPASNTAESKLPDLFLGLCRDLYAVADKRSERLFHKMLKPISVASLESALGTANKEAEVNSPFVYKDGVFPRLIRATYLAHPMVKAYIAKQMQPLMDLLVEIKVDLDFDPFTILLNLETTKARTGSSPSQSPDVGARLIYLKPPEDQLPLDIREANAKRRSIYENKPEVRRALEPKFDAIEKVMEKITSLLCSMTRTLPFALGEAMVEYHNSLVWCFTLREDKGVCTLALMRTLFHLMIAPALANPSLFDLTLPEKSPRELTFNLCQVAAIVDDCFAISRNAFETPWYGPLGRLSRALRERMMQSDLLESMSGRCDPFQPFSAASSTLMAADRVISITSNDLLEASLLKETVSEWLRLEPFVLYPSRRTLEFIRHRVAPFLVKMPNLTEIGDSAEIRVALDHFMDEVSPAVPGKSMREPGLASRRRMFARTRALSRSGTRLLSAMSFSRANTAEQLDKEEEERRINYMDFSDDWGYAIPMVTRVESLDTFLESVTKRVAAQVQAMVPHQAGGLEGDNTTTGSETNEQFLSESSEVIARVTELLVAFPFQGSDGPASFPSVSAKSISLPPKPNHSSTQSAIISKQATDVEQEFSLRTMMLQHLPEFESDLNMYATGSTEEERESSFIVNLLQKVLLMYVERVQARVSLSFRCRVCDQLLLDVKTGIALLIDRKQALEEYQDVLQKGNGFTQNRKVVEYFASEEGIKLTDPIRIGPGMSSKVADSRRSSRRKSITMRNPLSGLASYFRSNDA